jgi:Rrf2 family protein
MAATSQFSIAVHILTIIARSGGERVKSDCIARSVNTNPVVIRRLLSNLSESDLVVSQVGASGGTSLCKLPKDIRLSEIYKAVSRGEVFALHTNKPDEHCPVGKHIEAVLCGLQKEIDKSIEDKLNQYTLRDILEKIEDVAKIA